jgi:hypothetical protein
MATGGFQWHIFVDMAILEHQTIKVIKELGRGKSYTKSFVNNKGT